MGRGLGEGAPFRVFSGERCGRTKRHDVSEGKGGRYSRFGGLKGGGRELGKVRVSEYISLELEGIISTCSCQPSGLI